MQTPEDNRERENKDLEAPPALVSALKRLSHASIFVPPAVDEAILRAARRQFSQQNDWRTKWSLLIRWGVAAAALVLLLAIVTHPLQRHGSSSGPGFANGDLNHDGQVDILDAFALAREIKTAAHSNAQLDINGDGVVDDRDVAALAAQAVSLGNGGGS